MKTTCYHKIAVKKSLGLQIETFFFLIFSNILIETWRKINLTELKRKWKPNGEGKSGRKLPRVNDYEVIPAKPDNINEEDEIKKGNSFLSKMLEPAW